MAALSACASHEKSEARTGYTIYAIAGDPLTDTKKLYAAVKQGLEQTGYEFTVSMDPPPTPLPSQPGRFQVANPLKGSQLGALMAASGASYTTAQCDGASFVANLKNDSFKKFGEDTRFVTCIFPYTGGFSVSVWHRYSQNNNNLGASLARGVVGDSSQFIPRTIESIVAGIRMAGFQPIETESF